MMRAKLAAIVLAVMAAPALAQAPAQPQGANAPPNALQGFSQNRDKPVKIDAATLEVRDKNKLATFSGNVQVVQGDTVLRCKTLAVFYDQQGSGNAMPAAQPGPAGQQRIRRLEARGDVIVTQKDQTATGDLGVFDMASNTVALSGNVVVRQGQSVIQGKRLTVNLTTGVSHVEGGEGGRVQGLFMPSSGPEANAPAATSKPEPKTENREAPQRPAAPAARNGGSQSGAANAPARSLPRPSGLY
jgi:lipopolysaccharide export system protein LptA